MRLLFGFISPRRHEGHEELGMVSEGWNFLLATDEHRYSAEMGFILIFISRRFTRIERGSIH